MKKRPAASLEGLQKTGGKEIGRVGGRDVVRYEESDVGRSGRVGVGGT